MTEDNLKLGIEALNKGNLEKARDYLASAVKENPQSENGWFLLGKCLTNKEQRKYCFEKVLRLNPQHVEAQNELDRLFLSNVTEPLTSRQDYLNEIPLSPDIKKGETNWKSSPRFLSIMGVIAGLCICGIPLLFLINSGLLDSLTSFVGVNEQITATTIPTSSYLIAPTDSNTLVFALPTSPISVDNDVQESKSLLSQGRFAEAVALLDQVIQSAPELDEPYYLRSLSYNALTSQQRSLYEFEDYLDRALKDIDKAIALRSDKGDYFMLRQYILVKMANTQDYRANAQHISEYALENARAALNLGSTLDEYPERIYVLDLISTNRCKEAVEQLQKMIDQSDLKDVSIGGLYQIQSQAYICLGDVDKALEMVDKSMFNNTNMDWKYELKARYLYQAGRSDDALELLNTLIAQRPSYNGWRYYLRALIYEERGEREKAEEDLLIGAGNTWSHVGVFLYVKGKMALQDGNVEEGVSMLQEAEASLDYFFAPLQKRIHAELEGLGAKSLEIEPSTMLDATAIPTIQARPTARPLPTINPSITPLVTITPTPELSFPPNDSSAIIVDLGKGTGKTTLLPNDYPLFRFQPAEPIKVKLVKSLVIHLTPSSTETTNPDIQIYFWAPRGGGWGFIAPTWGDNSIDRASDYVRPEGDIFLAIRNWGTQPVTFDNITITLVIESQDGVIKTYGQK